ncbi:MAG TPA: helix-turn-helix domain-containing protein [Bryobacteraceae bacterium]|nr:helix-turn-helix domain-containing protein [Bryobacteraceae bacterium]
MNPGEPFNPHKLFIGLFIPVSLASSQTISSTAKLAWAHLARRAGNDCRCFPSRRDIAGQLGISETHVKRILAELESAALIRRIPRHEESGRQRSNRYEFLWHPMFTDSLKGEGHEDVPLPVEQPKSHREGHRNVPLEGRKGGPGQRHQNGPHEGHPNGPPLREKEEETSPSSSERSRREKPSQDSTPASESQNERPSKRSSSGPDDDENPSAKKADAVAARATIRRTSGESLGPVQVRELQEAERTIRGEVNRNESKAESETWASPQDELRAILKSKLGESVCIDDWDWIEEQIECRGIDWMAFVSEIRRHAANNWCNPVGFVKSRVKKFHARIARTAVPRTKGEVDEANYKCPICHSRKRGEGVRLIEGQLVPCECASPEYIEQQTKRGTFAA